LRPTSDKLRETLFNILTPRIDGARFVDGYAGTGAVGIEGAEPRSQVGDIHRERSARRDAECRESRATAASKTAMLLFAGVPSRERSISSMQRRSAPYELFDIVWLDSAVRRAAGRGHCRV